MGDRGGSMGGESLGIIMSTVPVELERTNWSYHKAHYDTFTIVICMLQSTCGYITEFWWI